MKKTILSISVAILAVTILSMGADAASITVQPDKIATMTSPDDKNETRVLVYFSMPEKLNNQDIHIDLAKLVFEAELTDADIAEIEIFPVTTNWTRSESIDWESSWEKEGGDYSIDNIGEYVTIKEADKSVSLQSNVTFIVKAWIDGTMDNEGIILISERYAEEDLKTKISIETSKLQLIINYNYQ